MNLYEFEESIIKAIQDGKIDDVKMLQLTHADVNRKLIIHHKIPVQNPALNRVFPELIDPTPVIFAIACEKSEILYYFIENLKPDLSICCNGWAPLHYAAIIESPSCMQILLKTEYIQANIDYPVQSLLSKDTNLTALHIAVSFCRHGQALLLTQNFMQPEFNIDIDRILFKNTPISDESAQQPADCMHRTMSGNTPLHIAAYRNDWDMCQILLLSVPDKDIINDKEQTPSELARFYGHNELADKLDAMKLDSIDSLYKKYVPAQVKVAPNNESHPASDEMVEELRENINVLKETINNLYSRIEELNKENQ